jgi:poly-beta-1,6-N-acetyl-D-glucosamine biosynthesis protein PgaD
MATGAIILFTLIVLGFNTLSLLSWRNFNKKKYGGLTRRRFPQATTDLELTEFFGVPEAKVSEMKKTSYIDL